MSSVCAVFFFFKQKTAYEMRISDWSSDVCSSDLRRILYAMKEAGYDWNRPYRKSARVVGDVMGQYHPHGDSAIYDTMVRLAQDFSMRLPLIDGPGNFGPMAGDTPAAMRYTEAREARAARDALLPAISGDPVA